MAGEEQRLYEVHRAHVAKYRPGRTPADGEPDEVSVVTEIRDKETGEIVTDPAVIERVHKAAAAAAGG